eukprot:290016-Pleurochrysis_carterae.AAC.7
MATCWVYNQASTSANFSRACLKIRCDARTFPLLIRNSLSRPVHLRCASPFGEQAVQLGIIRTVHGRPSASEQAAADLDGASRETPLLECELTGMQLYSQAATSSGAAHLASGLSRRLSSQLQKYGS